MPCEEALRRCALQRDGSESDFTMIEARNGRRYQQSSSTESATMENLVWKEMAMDISGYALVGKKRKQEVVRAFCNRHWLQGRLNHCASDSSSTRKQPA